MTFREALERELTTQGISVTEVARGSGVSKGTIYNILNGTTEDARIRPSTRRAIARGCNRQLKVLADGGVLFVEPSEVSEAPSDISLRFFSQRPFLSDHHVQEPFDWLHRMEETGALPGIRIVDRVFQRREDFLSLIVDNGSGAPIGEVQFDLRVVYEESGPAEVLSCRLVCHIPPGTQGEETLFLLAGGAFVLDILNPVFTDADGQTIGVSSTFTYYFKG